MAADQLWLRTKVFVTMKHNEAWSTIGMLKPRLNTVILPERTAN